MREPDDKAGGSSRALKHSVPNLRVLSKGRRRNRNDINGSRANRGAPKGAVVPHLNMQQTTRTVMQGRRQGQRDNGRRERETEREKIAEVTRGKVLVDSCRKATMLKR